MPTIAQMLLWSQANLGDTGMFVLKVFFWFSCVILAARMVRRLYREVRHREFRVPVVIVARLLKRMIIGFAVGTTKAMETPIERPATKLVIRGVSVLHSYSMAVIFFLFFAFVFVVAPLSSKDSFWHVFNSILIMAVLMFATVIFRAEADRDWLVFVEQWRVVFPKNNEQGT